MTASQIRKWVKFSSFMLSSVLLAQTQTLVGSTAERAFSELPVMMPMFSLTGEKQQVFPTIVEPVAVDMVNNFLWVKQTTKFLLNNPSVLKNVMAGPFLGFVWPQNLHVSIGGYSPTAFVIGTRFGMTPDESSATFQATPLSISGQFCGWIEGNWRFTIGAFGVFWLCNHARKLSTNSSPLST